jgi:hypothetical protein
MKLTRIFIITGIILALGWYGYRVKSERASVGAREKDAKAEQLAHGNARVAEFARRHNAIVDWEDELAKKAGNRYPYSFEIESLLVNAASRPVLVRGTVEDISRRGEKWFVHASSDFNLPTIRFLLECEPESAKRLAAASSTYQQSVILVASINVIEKPDLKATARSDESEGASIEIGPSDVLLARGRCVDWIILDSER